MDIKNSESPIKKNCDLIVLAIIFIALGFGLEWLNSKRPPLNEMFESLTFIFNLVPNICKGLGIFGSTFALVRISIHLKAERKS